MGIAFLPVTSAIKSTDGGAPSRFKLVNQSDSTLRLFWIDRDGKEIAYPALSKGQEYTQTGTSTSHSWLVRSDDGRIAFKFFPDTYGAIDVTNTGPAFTEFTQRTVATPQGQWDTWLGYGLIDVAKSLNVPDIGNTLSMRGQDNNIALNAVGAPSAWAAGFTGKGVTVAVIDSGVAPHAEISIAGGYDFADNDSDPSPDTGAYREHSLAVAANIAGRRDAGKTGMDTTGVAPEASILNVRVATSQGASDDSMARGIKWAVDNGAKVLCIPLQNSGAYGAPLLDAIQYAYDRGVVPVLIGGNYSIYGASGPALIAKLGIAIATGNLDVTSAQPFGTSNLAGETPFPWVMAPSTGYSPTSDGGYAYHTDGGTSYAGPYVAGLAALLVQKYPGASAKAIIDKIIAGATGQAGRIAGTAANDVLASTADSDMIDGAAGIDVVTYAGVRTDYVVTVSDTGFTVASRTQPGSMDSLLNVERLKFADASLALDWNGNAGQIYSLYQAAFNRAPDAAGIGFWLHARDGGMDMRAIATTFLDANESASSYPDNSDTAFLTRLYNNVFHRAPDAAGLAFHLANLEKHAVDRPAMLVDFTLSQENMAQLVGVMQNGMDFVQA